MCDCVWYEPTFYADTVSVFFRNCRSNVYVNLQLFDDCLTKTIRLCGKTGELLQNSKKILHVSPPRVDNSRMDNIDRQLQSILTKYL